MHDDAMRLKQVVSTHKHSVFLSDSSFNNAKYAALGIMCVITVLPINIDVYVNL